MISSSKSSIWPFPNQLLRGIKLHAEDVYPNECIGFIVERANQFWAVAMPAIAHARHVYIEPLTLISTIERLHKHAVRVVATYHSHPNGSTNLSDIDETLFLCAPIIILLARHEESWAPFVYKSSSS